MRKGDKHADSRSGLVLEEAGEWGDAGLQPQASGERVVSPLGTLWNHLLSVLRVIANSLAEQDTAFSFWPQARRGTAAFSARVTYFCFVESAAGSAVRWFTL